MKKIFLLLKYLLLWLHATGQDIQTSKCIKEISSCDTITTCMVQNTLYKIAKNKEGYWNVSYHNNKNNNSLWDKVENIGNFITYIKLSCDCYEITVTYSLLLPNGDEHPICYKGIVIDEEGKPEDLKKLYSKPK